MHDMNQMICSKLDEYFSEIYPIKDWDKFAWEF